jgi:ABC-type phosphate transport system substrate-binding protein
MMPHPLRHPTPHLALARPAAGVAVLLATVLTACTSTATSTPRPAAVAKTVVDLTGAGSTFDAPFFNLAFPAWQQAHLFTGVSYAAVGQRRRHHAVRRRAGDLRRCQQQAAAAGLPSVPAAGAQQADPAALSRMAESALTT